MEQCRLQTEINPEFKFEGITNSIKLGKDLPNGSIVSKYEIKEDGEPVLEETKKSNKVWNFDFKSGKFIHEH